MEQFCFRRDGDVRLLGMYFQAKGTRRGKILLCDPLYQDRNWASRQLWHFAAEAAENGYDVLRFNWFGFGDSDGDEEDISFESLQGDLKAALSELDRRAGEGKTTLIGLRAGGYLAALFAESHAEAIDGLVMWEPVPHFGTYLETELRATVTTQSTLLKEVVRTRQVILDNIVAGTFEDNIVAGLDWGNIEGFRLSPQIVRARADASLDKAMGTYKGPVFLCEIRPRPRPKSSPAVTKLAKAYEEAGCTVTADQAQQFPFWKNNNNYTQRAPALAKRTFQWLDETIHSS